MTLAWRVKQKIHALAIVQDANTVDVLLLRTANIGPVNLDNIESFLIEDEGKSCKRTCTHQHGMA